MESVAQSILSKFGQVLVDELKEIRGVGDKVVHLRDELATMNAVLRVISEADQDSVDHIVREWEKQVHNLVYDAEDCTDAYSLRIVRPIPLLTADDIGGSPLTFWPRYMFARAKHIVRYRYEKVALRRTLAADINALLDRTTIVSERRARYGIDRVALPRSACFAPVLAASMNSLRRADDPHQFVGITEQAECLALSIRLGYTAYAPVCLARNNRGGYAPVHDEDDKSLKTYSIVGFGGVGKTTLAMELCRQLDVDFPCQAWVSMSQAFDGENEKDIKGLLVRVLQQILNKKPAAGQMHRMNVKELSSKINELLDHKRYLIVVDDVWSLPGWEAIKMRLPENNYGSRIIVTTRIEAVARAASTKYFVHYMEPLELEASQQLFVKRVFGSTENCNCPKELRPIMKNILGKCGGLPLAIVIIAGLLAGYTLAEGREMWEIVSGSLASQMERQPTLEWMRQLITLIYGYLPRHLKACLMYVSIFPEGYMIGKDRLLYRWIAEGLVTENPGFTLLEVAEEYLNQLISRNMIHRYNSMCIDDPYYSEVGVEGYRVHAMILEAMVFKSKESNFVSLVGWQHRGMPHGHDKVRRLSLHGNDHDEQHQGVQGIEVMKVQHVRSLTTFQHYGLGLNILLNRLREFKLLRVLDLEDCKALQDKHMRDVCQLYLLRFLSLRGTNVSEISRKVGNLEHLETLDIKDTSIGERLPQTVTKLSKLENLRSNGWLLPRGLGNMKALREVDTGVLTGNDIKVADEIGKLTQLQLLRIRIDNYADHDFLDVVLASSLSKTHALLSLHLTYSNSRLEFLNDVSPPPTLLQCFSLYGSNSQLPVWISSLTHLTRFEVGQAELAGNQLFDVLCKLPNLQSIQLKENSYRDPELVARSYHYFPVLRILEVSSCPTLTKLRFEEGTMSELETLVLGFDNEKMSIVGVKNLWSLKQVKLRGNLAMGRAVQQLEYLNTFKSEVLENRQIKVVVDFN